MEVELRDLQAAVPIPSSPKESKKSIRKRSGSVPKNNKQSPPKFVR